jgi:hypothetical protein
MSKIDRLLESTNQLKEEQKRDHEKLLKVEGIMESVMKTSPPNSIDNMIATAFFTIVKEIRIFDTTVTHMYEVFLSLLSEQEKRLAGQQKEIDELVSILNKLESIVTSLTSERTELSKKIETIEKRQKKGEPILKHLHKYLSESGEFLEKHK